MDGQFLEVNKTGNFTNNLMIITSDSSKKQQVWRYFTAIFLTQDLNTLVTIIVILFFFVSLFERFMGNLCVAIVFFCSSVVMNFFIGSFYSVDFFFGCMSGIFGIFGCGISYIIINYSRMDSNPNLRYIFICNLVFVIIIGKSPSSYKLYFDE